MISIREKSELNRQETEKVLTGNEIAVKNRFSLIIQELCTKNKLFIVQAGKEKKEIVDARIKHIILLSFLKKRCEQIFGTEHLPEIIKEKAWYESGPIDKDSYWKKSFGRDIWIFSGEALLKIVFNYQKNEIFKGYDIFRENGLSIAA